MKKMKFEYIWLDGVQPEAHVRSKTKILEMAEFAGEIEKLPVWSFDGSSTQQAEGHSSDCLLKPVNVYNDAGRKNAWLVMCEVLLPDGTPHPTNTRAKVEDAPDYWFGFEQEYTLVKGSRPMGFPDNGFPAPQGMYYCSVGNDYIAGRDIVEEHLDLCLEAGLSITGINAEVMLGQWEYQVFGKGAKNAADDAWIARYLLFRTAEKYGIHIEFKPKPVKGDWNGSGMHTNFSNKRMREAGTKEYYINILEEFGKQHDDFILVYGSENSERLTGLHETQHIGTYSYGESDRGASIRIPVPTIESGYKSGYLEDRRPASNADPYRIVEKIITAVKSIN